MPYKLTPPTEDENRMIQAGIEADRENPELGAAFFTAAKPASQVLAQCRPAAGRSTE